MEARKLMRTVVTGRNIEITDAIKEYTKEHQPHGDGLFQLISVKWKEYSSQLSKFTTVTLNNFRHIFPLKIFQKIQRKRYLLNCLNFASKNFT